MSGSLVGGKVKEPKVRTYGRPLHVDVQSYKSSAALSDAWSSYGKAKSTLNHLESHLNDEDEEERTTKGVFPSQTPPPPFTRPHSDTKRKHVSSGAANSLTGDSSTRTKPSTKHGVSNESRNRLGKPLGEGVIEGTVLNETHQTVFSNAHTRSMLPHTDGPYDTTTLLSSVYRGPSPHTRDIPPSYSSPHSNPNPLFGPADFREHRSYHDVSPTPPHIHVTNGMNGTQDTRLRTITRKTRSTQGKTAATRVAHSDLRKAHTTSPMGGEPRLDLPKETISNLLETVERQKREFSEFKKKDQERRTAQHGIGNQVSSRMPASYRHSSGKPPSSDLPGPIKRRKVATAPPPKTYAGFTSIVQGPPPSLTSRPLTSFTSTVPKPDSGDREMAQKMHALTQPPKITPYSWRSGQDVVNRLLGKDIHQSNVSGAKRPRLPTAARGHLLTKLSNKNATELLQDLEDEEEEEEEIEEEERDETARGTSLAAKLRKVLHADSDLLDPPPKIVERHYDRESVQRYMKSKEDEKRRKVHEEKDAQRRAQQERERRLKELQDRQRQILTSNLMKQKRQREELERGDAPLLNYSNEVYTSFASPPLPSSVPFSSSYPPVTSPLYHQPSVSPPLVGTHTSPFIAHSFSSPVAAPVSLSFTTIPPSSSVGPRVNLTFNTPPLPQHNPQSQSHSPIPIPTSSYLSPFTTNVDVHSHGLSTSPHSASITPPRSPIRAPSTSPLGSPRRTPVSDHQQARILALKQSAIALREKILAQKNVMTSRRMYTPTKGTPEVSVHPVEKLPGISNIHQHAASLHAQQRREQAAITIQSLWKGYKVRKNQVQPVKPVVPTSLSSPRPNPQATPTIQVTPPNQRQTIPVVTSSIPVNTNCYSASMATPTTVAPTQTSPWLKGGGDHYSVINIYTRRQEQLKKMLEEHPVSTPVLVTERSSTVISNNNQESYTMNFDSHSHSTVSDEEDTDEERTDEEQQQREDQDRADQEYKEGDEVGVTEEEEESDVSSDHHSPRHEMSAITPPGSPSFHDSFTTPPVYHPSSVPPPELPPSDSQRRYSPHSLELKLNAELNKLEAVGEGVRQLERVESTRVVSLAQQETVALAQLLKSQNQSHQNQFQSVTDKAKQDSEHSQRELQKLTNEATKMSERLKRLEEQSKQEKERHQQEVKQVQAVSCQKVEEVTQRLLDSQSTMASAVIGATEKQLQSAQEMAVGVAKAAAQGAVLAALKPQSTTTPNASYKSDFEEPSSFLPSSSLMATLTPSTGPNGSSPVTDNIPTAISSDTHTKLSPQLSGGSTRSQSLTPVPSERSVGREEEEDEEEGERTVTEMGSDQEDRGEEEKRNGEPSLTEEVSEEISNVVEDEDREEEEDDDDNDEEEISEVSFRELLPSESHLRQQMRRMKPTYRDTHDPPVQPNQQSGEVSPTSATGDESFFDFMSRMLQQYVREEEMRSKHQAALLELREKAIKEKTEAQLKWLTIRKGQVQKRGDDVAIPPLLKREKGILKKLQHEQAEIERLKEAHRAASHERKLLLLQQQDISRMHRSAHYYRDKIRRYGAQNSREQSPFTDLSLSPSPSPSISLSQEDIREQLSSLSSSVMGSPVKTLSHSTSSIPEMVNQSLEATPPSIPHQTVPVVKYMSTSDPDSMKLRQKSSQEAERLLNKRTEQLIKRRKKAEDLLRAEQDILRRKRELDVEEERIAAILEQAKECHEQMEGKREQPSFSTSATPISPIDTTKMSSTINEELSVGKPKSSEIPEEISEIPHSTDVPEEATMSKRSMRDYGTSTFESINSGPSVTSGLTPPPLTSTPEHSKSQTEDAADLESKQIEELKRQLREKELELEKQKQRLALLSKGPKLLKMNKGDQDRSKSLTASVLSTELTTPTKSKDSTLSEEPVKTVTPDHLKDGVLSPVSSGTSSSSSASTVISVEEMKIEQETEKREGSLSDEEPVIEEEETPVGGEEDKKVTDSINDQVDEPVESVVKKELTDQEVKVPGLVSEGMEEESDVEEEVESGEESGSVEALSPLQLSPIAGKVASIEEEPQSDHEPLPTPLQQPAIVSPSQSPQPPLIPETGARPAGVSEDIAIGARVLVGGKVEGTVQYIGGTGFAKGVWIGVELDYQKGINDGSVDGKRYFSCSDKYGVFAPPSKVVPLKTDPLYSESETESDEEIEEEVEDDEQKEMVGVKENKPPVMEVKVPKEDEHSATKGEESDDSESVSLSTEGQESDRATDLTGESPKHILAVSKDLEIPVDGVTEGLLQQLTAEAFNTVHSLWKEKEKRLVDKDKEEKVEKKEEEVEEEHTTDDQLERKAAKTKDELVEGITDDLLKVLISSEVSVMCNIRSAKCPAPEAKPAKKDASPRHKSSSFSSEPLSLVPCSREAVDCVTLHAWNLVMNSDDLPEQDLEPPPEVVKSLCTMSPGPMLACQESFVRFVHQLAIETIAEHKKQHRCGNGRSLASRYSPRPLTLEHVQTDVYMTLNQCKQPMKLPPVRYLHGNCRPGGKAVDSVDMLLIKELREEESSWINYDQDEEDVKIRTADEILDLLLDETVDVLNRIYNNKKTLQYT